MPDWGSPMDLVGQLFASASPTPSPSPSDASFMPPDFSDGTSAQPQATPIDWSFLVGGDKSWAQIQEYLRNTGRDISQALTPSPQSQLAKAIYDQIKKKAGGKFVDERIVAQAAQRAAARAENDPAYRAELAQYLGWNTTDPSVQRWVSQGGQIPSPSSTVATGGKGTGTSGTGQPSTDPSAASVQDPFPSQYFNDPNYHGNNYGDQKPAGVYWGGWTWHQGQDYGVPQGTPLSFPFAGKVVQVGYEPQGYGNFVTIEFGNGLRMTYAHLSYVQVTPGDMVKPGQQVGLSGGAGPGSGISTGAHLLVVLQDQRGNPIDPRPLLGQIYQGTTLAKLQALGVADTGTPQNAGSYTTPDGHVIYKGTADDSYYSLIATPYEHYYGAPPPWSLVMAMRQQGVTNSDQMAAIAANWPSDIPGLSFGQRENIYNTANGIAMKEFGRPIPDSLVKQFAQQGITSNDGIQLWFASHLPSEMPKDDYQQLYDATNPMFQQTYGESPSPEYIGFLWGQTAAPQGGSTSSSAGGGAPANVGTTG